jgi:hypothetical protein
MRANEFITEAWSEKYKRSINCSNPKGFSQKAHCQGKKKTSEDVVEGAAELLKAEMQLVRHIEKELERHGYQKGTDEYTTVFNHTLDYYRKFGNVNQIKKQTIEEDLRKWFKEKWVRFGPDGKIRGACARGSESEGKPKCLPQKKAHALGKKKRASAASRKRRQDPNPERQGKAKNVATKSTRDKK